MIKNIVDNNTNVMVSYNILCLWVLLLLLQV